MRAVTRAAVAAVAAATVIVPTAGAQAYEKRPVKESTTTTYYAYPRGASAPIRVAPFTYAKVTETLRRGHRVQTSMLRVSNFVRVYPYRGTGSASVVRWVNLSTVHIEKKVCSRTYCTTSRVW